MNIFEENYLKAKSVYSETEGRERSTVSTAHFAFGGHISKGLLNRGRSSLSKINAANEKQGRAKIFFDLSQFKDLNSYRVSPEVVFLKKEAIKNFIKKYAGKRIGNKLTGILFSYTPG